LLLARYLTQGIVGLFNTPLRFFAEGQTGRGAAPRPNVQRGKKVNKTELIEEIAKSADLTKASAARALDAMIIAVTTTLKNNDSVTLVGFGTFTVGERAARTGRDPRTKEAIKIKAAKVPKFKAGKALKDAVN
jgi:DNA-binding protein HU-beta